MTRQHRPDRPRLRWAGVALHAMALAAAVLIIAMVITAC